MNSQKSAQSFDNLGKARRKQIVPSPSMNITLLVKRPRKLSIVNIGFRSFVFAFSVISLLLGGIIYGGIYFGKLNNGGSEINSVSSFRDELVKQKAEVGETMKMYQEHMNAMAMRLGQIQARVLRLDALGKRLTEVAHLDRGEFNFDTPPAQGGPMVDQQESNANKADILASLDRLSEQLNDRENQLEVLEKLLMTQKLQEQVFPSGWPISKGWVSSYFGMRTDPFTGKRARHEGIDFAGKEGSPVVAVASGVVVYSGQKFGFGRVVELNHGNGYLTRYAHNKKNLVKTGARVEKGEMLARMGSTGRSTGPHVHFEVLRHNRVVNPAKYIQASR